MQQDDLLRREMAQTFDVFPGENRPEEWRGLTEEMCKELEMAEEALSEAGSNPAPSIHIQTRIV